MGIVSHQGEVDPYIGSIPTGHKARERSLAGSRRGHQRGQQQHSEQLYVHELTGVAVGRK